MTVPVQMERDSSELRGNKERKGVNEDQEEQEGEATGAADVYRGAEGGDPAAPHQGQGGGLGPV